MGKCTIQKRKQHVFVFFTAKDTFEQKVIFRIK
ncbi:hypothetical protein COLO4_02124 [Corchorus olitorius]|uniref:Uncharacterized protein n=1 Tax=Corchorus olitorius TaxID=93759 RepID=A0A1R3L1G8_9ROSI|nr:hypothetical protein COLO4_02124 [Corchorus olitorius]